MSLGEKLKAIRKENELSMDDLSAILNKKHGLNISKSMISRWENNLSEPLNTYLSAYAKEFNQDMNYLLGIVDSVEFVGKIDIINDYPYIDSAVAAGSPFSIEAQNYSTISIPNSFLGEYANHKKLFFMRINGNSMNRVIPDKSLIGIIPYETTYDLKNNDIVVFNYEGDYSVKRFLRSETKIIFRPDSFSEAYTDIVYNLAESTVEVIGKVIMYNVIL